MSEDFLSDALSRVARYVLQHFFGVWAHYASKLYIYQAQCSRHVRQERSSALGLEENYNSETKSWNASILKATEPTERLSAPFYHHRFPRRRRTKERMGIAQLLVVPRPAFEIGYSDMFSPRNIHQV